MEISKLTISLKNNLGDDGMCTIGLGLKANTTLTHINLKDKAVQQTLL